MYVFQVLKRFVLISGFAAVLALAFQNCSGTSFKAEGGESAQTSGSQPVESRGNDAFTATPEIALANKYLSFYGTRVNGQLALVAQISAATTVPLTISLAKSCGSLVDSQILGNGSTGQFVFFISEGQTSSQPVILSNFPSGQIVWKVNIQVTNTARMVTDLIQSCSPWLQSGGDALCPAPNNQPYCIDRGQ